MESIFGFSKKSPIQRLKFFLNEMGLFISVDHHRQLSTTLFGSKAGALARMGLFFTSDFSSVFSIPVLTESGMVHAVVGIAYEELSAPRVAWNWILVRP